MFNRNKQRIAFLTEEVYSLQRQINSLSHKLNNRWQDVPRCNTNHLVSKDAFKQFMDLNMEPYYEKAKSGYRKIKDQE